MDLYRGGANGAEILALRPWRADTGVPAMHLQPVAAQTWVRPPVDVTQRRRDKTILLDSTEPVYACAPGATAAAAEVATLVGTSGPEPLRAAALAVCDDLCVLQQRDGSWHLTAAALCQPSYWRLTDKLHQPMAAIHTPVPGLNARIGRRIDTFFARLPPGRLFERANWFIHASGQLYQPHLEDPWPDDNAELAACLHVRCERQTLQRLPDSGALLFTILVLTAPLLEVAGSTGVRAELLAAAGRVPPEHPKWPRLSRWRAVLEAVPG